MQTSPHPLVEILGMRDIRYFAGSRFFSACSRRLLPAAIAWHVYELTGSALHLGMIGLVQFLPAVPVSLVAGAVADRYERRRIVLLSQLAGLIASLALTLTSATDSALAVLYLTVFALAISSAFESPARQAMLPAMVSRAQFPTAVTFFSSIQNLAWMSGPVILGFVVAAWGIQVAYAINTTILLASLLLLLPLRARRIQGEGRAVSWESIRQGLDFVWRRPIISSAMILDMFAVVFARANALLPIFANDILEVGPQGYGLLAASMEAGTLLMALVLMVRPPIERPGRALLLAVALYGVATVVFGLSRSFPLSLAAFVLAGMADQVSMVTRASLIQLSTPDALRGRVSSVNMIFINASNQLGAAESGFLAALVGAQAATVFGGLACLVVLGIVARQVPQLRHHRPAEYEDVS
jgi:MFS family permease